MKANALRQKAFEREGERGMLKNMSFGEIRMRPTKEKVEKLWKFYQVYQEKNGKTI